MNQQRLVRLFSIIGQISPYSQLTVHELSQEYEVHPRTIERDIEVLQDAKLGVYLDENEKIKIHKLGYKKIKQWMSGEGE